MILIFLSFFNYLSVPNHSRIVYSGGAFSSYREQPENLFWNPAGVGGEGYISAIHNYSGINFSCIGGVKKINKIHLGIGLGYFYSGNIVETNSLGDSTGMYSYYSLSPLISGTYNSDDFSTGLKLFVPYTRVTEYSSYGIGMDVGIQYSILENLTLSLYGKNIGFMIGGSTDNETFPDEYRTGVLYNLNSLNISLEYSSLFDFSTSLQYKINHNIDLTLGYNHGLKDLRNGGDPGAGFSFGLNFKIKKINIDLGVVSYGPLGISRTIALGIK